MSRVKALMAAGISAEAAKSMTGRVQSLVIAGSTSADAALITSDKVLLTTASAGGAILPASDAGDEFMIKNEAGNTCTLYPPTGATINTTTSLSVPTAKSCVIFFSSPTACHSIPTVVS